jgi:hypothetical protein
MNKYSFIKQALLTVYQKTKIKLFEMHNACTPFNALNEKSFQQKKKI